MKKLFAAVLMLASAFAAAQTTNNFTFGPRPTITNIAPMTSVNGVSVDPATNSTVDFQTSDFSTAPGFALYFPYSIDGTSGILEGGTIQYGVRVITGVNTATQSDTFSFFGGEFTGTVIETFTFATQRVCGGRSCHNVTVYTSTGGTGTLTKN
jgi:hypothetical protein